jgi:hypothetical protein
LALAAGYDWDSGGSPSRRGNAVPAANKNQARKMYQGAFSMVRNGIGSEIGSAANTPIMARHPEITNKAIFGACKVIATFRALPEARSLKLPNAS